jgi:hypothetical protein
MRPTLGDDPAHCLEHRGDGRLVVRTEDRSGAVADDAVLDQRLDRPFRRDRVEVRAEEDRGPAPVTITITRGRDAAQEIPGRAADPRAGVVLVDGESEVAQVARDEVGDRPLGARRARDRGQLDEQSEDVDLGAVDPR